ncbi:UNVERIFIED_CONTAM: Serrate RNA effector molecule [Sesamum calycinum]|uniref:Serrate RNA effector molecule n=1 Tax=Sesamum calycinum TaxID=2727403 RepID=A0AAW2J2E6_9LAMI
MAEVLSGTMDNLDQDNNANPTDDKPSATAPADAGPDSTSSPPPPPDAPIETLTATPESGVMTARLGVDTMIAIARRLHLRHRRRDDGYDGRRGSPRGGYGPGDRRFGYGFERDMGGRPGYPDERFHGRYMGRPSAGYPGGPSDWDSGRAGFADTFGAGGAQREGMMSYKQFIQELEDDVLPAEAERRLKDKYHPTNLLAVIERRNEVARKSAKDFQLDLQSGTLDLGPGVMPSSLNKDQISEANSDDEADVGGKRRRHGRGGTKESDLSSAPKAHPVFSESRRIQGLEGIELLDTLLTYLWRIHGVDYYVMVESNEAKGLRHVRVDDKNSDANGNANEWEKKLDSHWQKRLKGSDPLEVMAAKEKIDAAAAEALDPYVRKIRDEKYGWKYGCGAKVTKMHPEAHCDAAIFSCMKERPRHRPGTDNRMKDERGNRRERDNRANERFDRSENPQSGDFPSSNDGPPGENPDDPMFDTFGAQGIPVGPFPSDIPPPVLMPVPGAGPLGPFVPAPPEVAMRMLRDQGGPSPFEGGRHGIPGPQISGPAPIIALPPTFRQDPRRLRRKRGLRSDLDVAFIMNLTKRKIFNGGFSYNDLDAPDDEVTVIDYRSL